jgi:hypothetical protein
MKKLALLFVVFASVAWSNVSAQGYPISVVFSNLDPNCQVSVIGSYLDSLTGAQGTLVFNADPSGNYTAMVLMNAFSQSTTVNVCAQYCDGSVECQTLPIIPGAITTFYFSGTGNGGGEVDLDGDGFFASVDCNDADALVNPSAAELCDGIDNNCNNQIDEGCVNDCSVDIVLVPDSLVNAPYTVYIYMGNADPTASFIWSFGNGNTAGVAYPTWVYDSLGTYTVCCTVAFPDGCTATDCVTFTVNADGTMSPGGIQMQGFTLNVLNEMPIADGIAILDGEMFSAYPNPFENSLILENHHGVEYYQLFTSHGQLVSQGNGSGQKRLQLNTEDLNSGLYLLKVISKNGSEVRQVVKK